MSPLHINLLSFEKSCGNIMEGLLLAVTLI